MIKCTTRFNPQPRTYAQIQTSIGEFLILTDKRNPIFIYNTPNDVISSLWGDVVEILEVLWRLNKGFAKQRDLIHQL